MNKFDFNEMIREIIEDDEQDDCGLLILKSEAQKKYNAITRALRVREVDVQFYSPKHNIMTIQLEDDFFDSVTDDLKTVFKNADHFIICLQNGKICVEIGIEDACTVVERSDDDECAF